MFVCSKLCATGTNCVPARRSRTIPLLNPFRNQIVRPKTVTAARQVCQQSHGRAFKPRLRFQLWVIARSGAQGLQVRSWLTTQRCHCSLECQRGEIRENHFCTNIQSPRGAVQRSCAPATLFGLFSPCLRTSRARDPSIHPHMFELSDVGGAKIQLADIALVRRLRAVRVEFFERDRSARTAVAAASLVGEDRIEITAIARQSQLPAG